MFSIIPILPQILALHPLPEHYRPQRFLHLKKILWLWLNEPHLQEGDIWIEKLFKTTKYGPKDRAFYRDFFFLFLRFGYGAWQMLKTCVLPQTPVSLMPPHDTQDLKEHLQEFLVWIEDQQEWEKVWLHILIWMEQEGLNWSLKERYTLMKPQKWWLNIPQSLWTIIESREVWQDERSQRYFFSRPPKWIWWYKQPIQPKNTQTLGLYHVAEEFADDEWPRERLNRDFWIQDINSQRACDIVRGQKGDFIWDVCAGAGGKSIKIAHRAHFQGLIWSTDIRKRILEELEERIKLSDRKMLIKSSVLPKHMSSDHLPTEMKQAGQSRFDVILIDAPCSGLGRLRRTPSLVFWEPSILIKKEKITQQSLLKETSTYLANNGQLVYMTCSFAREENEEQIDLFLSHHPHFKKTGQHFLSHPDYNGDTLMVFVLEK